jgi:hypothetical protein
MFVAYPQLTAGNQLTQLSYINYYNINACFTFTTSNVEWIRLMFRIHKVLGSNIGPGSALLTGIFSDFPQFYQTDADLVL